DRTPQQFVVSEVNHTHPAFADRRLQQVAVAEKLSLGRVQRRRCGRKRPLHTFDHGTFPRPGSAHAADIGLVSPYARRWKAAHRVDTAAPARKTGPSGGSAL